MIRTLAFALALAFPAVAQAKSVPPRNECEAAQGAAQFRLALATATANRDETMLKLLVHPQVHLDFGGGTGWDTMRERLDGGYYNLWEELEQVQMLGCGTRSDANGDELFMPWYWGEDLGTDDAFSTFIVTGSDVPMYSSRDGSSDARTLDWEVVTLLDEWSENASGLAHVRIADGREGYVDWASLRSQVDYRLIASRDEESGWQIIVFIAGD